MCSNHILSPFSARSVAPIDWRDTPSAKRGIVFCVLPEFSMRRRLLLLSLVPFTLGIFFLLLAQPSVGQEKIVLDATFFDVFQARNIGPANMGGRIVDL